MIVYRKNRYVHRDIVFVELLSMHLLVGETIANKQRELL